MHTIPPILFAGSTFIYIQQPRSEAVAQHPSRGPEGGVRSWTSMLVQILQSFSFSFPGPFSKLISE